MSIFHKTRWKWAIFILVLCIYWSAGFFPFILNSPQIGFNSIASKYAQGRICLVPFIHYHMDSPIDWAINLIGFIPLGYLIVAMPGMRRSILYATILCAFLSLSIETGQLFLAIRITSTEDLIFNTLGGLIGAWIAQATNAQWEQWGREQPLGSTNSHRK